MREGRVQSVQRAAAAAQPQDASTPKLLAEFPAHLRAYDLLVDGGEDLRERPFAERRARLEALRRAARRSAHRPLAAGAVRDLGRDRRRAQEPGRGGRRRRCRRGRGRHAQARDAPYVPGRPKGLWWKWKRDPFIVDAVLMYAQRGHGKRSSFYSDYTFGVWTAGEEGDVLVPVGKAYFGFTDEELLQIDRYVRRNTIERFGPVREVVHERRPGLVLEVAFEGLAALDPPQIRARHALSAHQPPALGQAARRGRPARNARADAGADRAPARSRPRRIGECARMSVMSMPTQTPTRAARPMPAASSAAHRCR